MRSVQGRSESRSTASKNLLLARGKARQDQGADPPEHEGAAIKGDRKPP
jgi:hypothetical protein